MIHLANLYEIENMFIQLIGGVGILFIQGHMLVDGPVGDPSRSMQIKHLRLLRFGDLTMLSP